MNIKDKLKQKMNEYSDMNIFEKILTGIVGGMVLILLACVILVVIALMMVLGTVFVVSYVVLFPIAWLVEIIKGGK